MFIASAASLHLEANLEATRSFGFLHVHFKPACRFQISRVDVLILRAEKFISKKSQDSRLISAAVAGIGVFVLPIRLKF